MTQTPSLPSGPNTPGNPVLAELAGAQAVIADADAQLAAQQQADQQARDQEKQKNLAAFTELSQHLDSVDALGEAAEAAITATSEILGTKPRHYKALDTISSVEGRATEKTKALGYAHPARGKQNKYGEIKRKRMAPYGELISEYEQSPAIPIGEWYGQPDVIPSDLVAFIRVGRAVPAKPRKGATNPLTDVRVTFGRPDGNGDITVLEDYALDVPSLTERVILDDHRADGRHAQLVEKYQKRKERGGSDRLEESAEAAERVDQSIGLIREAFERHMDPDAYPKQTPPTPVQRAHPSHEQKRSARGADHNLPVDPDKVEYASTSFEQAVMLLSYEDTLPDSTHARFHEIMSSDQGRKYAEQLEKLLRTRNGQVAQLAHGLAQQASLAVARKLAIQPSQFTRSTSWALWDIAKQVYYLEHQAEADPRYTLGNPLDDSDKATELLDRQVGWEAYEVLSQLPGGVRTLQVQQLPHAAEILQYLARPPKTNGSLSSKELAELGALIRKPS